jgi:tetratricopeptide (TPR) repeat protein
MRVFVLAMAFAALALRAADTPASLTDRAQQLAQQNQLQEAEKLWKQALALDAGYFPALFNLGYMNFTLDRLDQASEYLQKAAKAGPREFNAHYLLGVVRQKQNDAEGALRAWKQALAIRPDQTKLMQVMAVEYAKGRYYNEAAQMARAALKLQPNDLNAHLVAITACRQAGDRESGLAIAEQAVKKFPESARANFEYAWHLQKFGNVAEGLPYLEKALELDPDYEEPYFYYGDWLVSQGRDAEAIGPLQRAIALRDDYIPARTRLGQASMGLERYEDAIRELDETIKREPRHPQPHLLLSQIYFRLKDRKRAAQEKKLSLQLRRENPAYLEAIQGRPFPEE